MSRLTVRPTPGFEEALSAFIKIRHLRTKSEAVRLAIQEAVEREQRLQTLPDFSQWIGLALQAPLNLNPRFRSDDDL